MDIATLLGAICGLGVCVVAMFLASGSLLPFLDLASIVIVMGGAIFASAIRWSLPQFIAGLKASLKTILTNSVGPDDIIKQVIDLATTARKESILALERVTVTHEFLAKAVRYLVDGYPPETIEEMIDLEIDNMAQRHKYGKGLMDNLGEAAPAFGMIGTVVGLIQIMNNLDDPSKIGPGIAVALITTLYGALLANLFFIPLASKLAYRSAEEVMNMEIIREGVNAISKGENPKITRQKLDAYLAPVEREES